MSKEFVKSNTFSLPGSRMAFFGNFCVLICLFAGVSTAQAASICDFRMTQNLEAKTRFLDAKEVAKSSAQQLQADVKMYVEVRENLRNELNSATAKNYNLFESMLRNVSVYVELLERTIEQKRAAKPAAPDVAPVKQLSVTEKSSRELFRELMDEALTYTSNPIGRFFPIARQDLVLKSGTDRTGMKWEDSWDEWGLVATLRQHNLNIEDGMYSLPLEEMKACDVDEHGLCPYVMIQDFMRGERGFAIYDGDQMWTDGPDFYIFTNPAEKVKALKAVILPAR
jgi:hypothetical protein